MLDIVIEILSKNYNGVMVKQQDLMTIVYGCLFKTTTNHIF